LSVSSKSKHMEMAHKVYRFRMKNLQLAVLGYLAPPLCYSTGKSQASPASVQPGSLCCIMSTLAAQGGECDAMPLCPSRGKTYPITHTYSRLPKQMNKHSSTLRFARLCDEAASLCGHICWRSQRQWQITAEIIKPMVSVCGQNCENISQLGLA